MQSSSQFLQHLWTRLGAMSDFEIIIGLGIVAVLASYLCIKRCQRAFGQPERRDPAVWTGKPIDVSKLKPTLEGVRFDYLAVRKPARGGFFHRSLLGLARRAVARLAYFQCREPESHLQNRGL